MTAIVKTILKNVHGESVVKFVGTGTIQLLISDLIVKTIKKANVTSGQSTITLTGLNGNDNVGIVIGGAVTGTGIQANTVVTAIQGRTITLSKTANATNSNVSLTFDSQIFSSPNSLVSIEKIYWSTVHADGIKLEKATGTLIGNFYGSDHWNLNEMSINETINAELNVTTADDDTMILKLKKYGS